VRPVRHPDPLLNAAIGAVPGWSRSEAHVTPIEEGRTNRNFRVDVDDAAYFLRLSDKETELLGIDRTAEHQAALAAAAAGVGPEVVAFLPELGCLVTRWVPGLPLAEGDLEDEEILESAVRVVRTIHGCPALPSSFSSFRIVEDYRRIAEDRDVVVPDAFGAAHAMAARIEEAFDGTSMPVRPCHNDLLAPNFIREDDAMWLVDHEYAGMGDPYFDLGNLSINNRLSESAQERLLQLYFGEVTDAHRARLGLMRIMSDFREAMWGVVQQGLSTLDIDYVAYAQTHFDRLARTMADPRFERWLDDAAGTS
jgi:thiamine kinase-like enzyme